MPATFQPLSHPTLVSKPPEGRDWIHEIKFDGWRMQLNVAGEVARWFTRNGLDWTDKLPGLAASTGKLQDCILDGELCALDEEGRPSFSKLRRNMTPRLSGNLVFFAFDILWRGETDLRPYALSTRKISLATVLDEAGPSIKGQIRYVDHFADAPAVEQISQAVVELRRQDHHPARFRPAEGPVHPEPLGQRDKGRTSILGRIAFGQFEHHPHEEGSGGGVAELLRVGDIGVALQQEGGDGRDDAVAVRTGKGQDHSEGRSGRMNLSGMAQLFAFSDNDLAWAGLDDGRSISSIPVRCAKVRRPKRAASAPLKATARRSGKPSIKPRRSAIAGDRMLASRLPDRCALAITSQRPIPRASRRKRRLQ